MLTEICAEFGITTLHIQDEMPHGLVSSWLSADTLRMHKAPTEEAAVCALLKERYGLESHSGCGADGLPRYVVCFWLPTGAPIVRSADTELAAVVAMARRIKGDTNA